MISDGVAYEVTRILEENIQYGTGTGAAYGQDAAGKTGTTEEHSDAWFCGYTPRLATTVWVGYPKAKIPMENVHGISVAGGTFPADIWRLFMSSAIGQLDSISFPEPTDWPEWTDVRARHVRTVVRLQRRRGRATTTAATSRRRRPPRRPRPPPRPPPPPPPPPAATPEPKKKKKDQPPPARTPPRSARVIRP